MMTATATAVRVTAPEGWHGATVGSWDEAFSYILHQQAQSVAYALTYGWRIVETLAHDVYVGRTREGHRIYVSCELRSIGEGRTTDHAEQAYAQELAFTGTIVRKGGQLAHDGDCISFGQIDTDAIRTGSGEGRFAGHMRDLANLWDRAHLGGMRALCVHQQDKRDERGGYDLDNIARCPVSGYRPGSAWLRDPSEVTDGYVERARALFGV